MFGTVFIPHILQKALLELCSTGCLVPRININSLAPLSKWLQHLEKMEDMCRNQKHICCCSHFSIVICLLMSSKLHSEEQVILPLSLVLRQSSQNAIQLIEHVIVDAYEVMQWYCMPLRHLQNPISDWSQYFHHIVHNSPFIMCCEEWPGITVLWILLTLGWKFPSSVGVLQ
jgi:hypothetical protein